MLYIPVMCYLVSVRVFIWSNTSTYELLRTPRAHYFESKKCDGQQLNSLEYEQCM